MQIRINRIEDVEMAISYLIGFVHGYRRQKDHSPDITDKQFRDEYLRGYKDGQKYTAREE